MALLGGGEEREQAGLGDVVHWHWQQQDDEGLESRHCL
jgi:hypothetical protein